VKVANHGKKTLHEHCTQLYNYITTCNELTCIQKHIAFIVNTKIIAINGDIKAIKNRRSLTIA